MLKKTRVRLLAVLGVLTGMAAGTAGIANADPPTPPPIWRLINQASGQCLTATGTSGGYYAVQALCNGGPAQQWQTEVVAWYGSYLMDKADQRCLRADPGSSSVTTQPCDWNGYFNGPNGWDRTQMWNANYNNPSNVPTTGGGACLGVLGNSTILTLGCSGDPTVTWYH